MSPALEDRPRLGKRPSFWFSRHGISSHGSIPHVGARVALAGGWCSGPARRGGRSWRAGFAQTRGWEAEASSSAHAPFTRTHTGRPAAPAEEATETRFPKDGRARLSLRGRGTRPPNRERGEWKMGLLLSLCCTSWAWPRTDTADGPAACSPPRGAGPGARLAHRSTVFAAAGP